MKRVIDKKMYNTETAEQLGHYWNGLGPSDFRNLEETLYKTKKGVYFIHGSGGPLTKYAVAAGSNSTSGSDQIIPLSRREAIQWAEDNEVTNLFEPGSEFADDIEDA